MQNNRLLAEPESMRRTTVSFDDDQYEILEKWAEKEVRTVANLITAIVVGVLRGNPPEVPNGIDEITADPEDKG
jgi:hypothetical protein